MKRDLPIALLALAGFLALAAGVPAEEAQLEPRIVFEEPIFDFGEVSLGETVTHEYAFRNDGGRDLYVTQAKSSCGCTVASWTREPIPPGGTGVVGVRFDTRGRPNQQSKDIRVYCSDPLRPQVVLTIKGFVASPPAPILRYDPPQVDLKLMEPNGFYEAEITIQNAGRDDLEIKAINAQPPDLVAALEGSARVPPGGMSRIRIAYIPGEASTGGYTQRYVNVRTNDPSRQNVTIGVKGYIQKPRPGRLESVRTELDVGVVDHPGQVVLRIPVMNTGDLPVTLVRTQVLGSAVEVVGGQSVEVPPGGHHELEIRSRAQLRSGSFQDRILLFGSEALSPHQPSCTVILIGYVAPEADTGSQTTGNGTSLKPETPGTPGKFTLVYQGDRFGEIAPCNCTGDQKGGFAREGTAAAELAGQTTLLVNTGNIFGYGEYALPARGELAVLAMDTIGYNVTGINGTDFMFGHNFLADLADRTRMRFVSANVRDLESGKPAVGARYSVHDLDGTKVLVTSVAHPDTPLGVGSQVTGVEVMDPFAALKEVLPEMASQGEVIIVLSNLGLDGSERIASSFPDVDIVVVGNTPEELVSPRPAGQGYLVSTNAKGQYLGVAQFAVSGKMVKPLQGQHIELGPSVADQPEIVQMVLNYRRSLKDLPPPAPEALSEGESYVGSAACQECHEAASKIWAASEHAHAFASLQDVAVSAEYDPTCTRCHVTGYGKATGFLHLDTTPDRIEVGCESCHGPGGRHAASPEPGYGKAGPASCQVCHTGDHSPHFEFQRYWERIQHE